MFGTHSVGCAALRYHGSDPLTDAKVAMEMQHQRRPRLNRRTCPRDDPRPSGLSHHHAPMGVEMTAANLKHAKAALAAHVIPVGDTILMCLHTGVGKAGAVMELSGELMWVFTCEDCYEKPGVQLRGGPAEHSYALDPKNLPELRKGSNGRGKWIKRGNAQ